MFKEPQLMPIEVLHCENMDFRPFWLLWPWPMTFIYELDPYSVEIQCMCKYELPTSKLSKVIVWQTDTTEIIYHAASRVVKNAVENSHPSYCNVEQLSQRADFELICHVCWLVICIISLLCFFVNFCIGPAVYRILLICVSGCHLE